MRIVVIIIRVLLGLAFVFSGLNAIFQFFKPPPMAGLAGDFINALAKSHYIYALGAVQFAGGFLLLIGRFVPLGLTLLGPVVVNILLFHIFLEPKGLPIAIVFSALTLIVLWYHRAAFAGLAKASA
jgi:uncharacterized membrane protein YphA (DoxX/SURF4 family)